jgi:protein-glutamine gamma-glutamyltransferase
MLVLLGWLALITWHIGRSMRPRRPDAVAQAYALLCRKLARTGLMRAPYQGPLAYAQALRAAHPGVSEGAHTLLAQYARLRYGVPEPATRARDVERFARSVRRLRIPRPMS